MATKSANLYVRIEPDVKEQAEGILAALGIPASNAINMFTNKLFFKEDSFRSENAIRSSCRR